MTRRRRRHHLAGRVERILLRAPLAPRTGPAASTGGQAISGVPVERRGLRRGEQVAGRREPRREGSSCAPSVAGSLELPKRALALRAERPAAARCRGRRCRWRQRSTTGSPTAWPYVELRGEREQAVADRGDRRRVAERRAADRDRLADAGTSTRRPPGTSVESFDAPGDTIVDALCSRGSAPTRRPSSSSRSSASRPCPRGRRADRRRGVARRSCWTSCSRPTTPALAPEPGVLDPRREAGAEIPGGAGRRRRGGRHVLVRRHGRPVVHLAGRVGTVGEERRAGLRDPGRVGRAARASR